MKFDEKEGIKAIIYLQKIANITETEEKATRGWRGMSVSEKETTMRIYHLMHSKAEKE